MEVDTTILNTAFEEAIDGPEAGIAARRFIDGLPSDSKLAAILNAGIIVIGVNNPTTVKMVLFGFFDMGRKVGKAEAEIAILETGLADST